MEHALRFSQLVLFAAFQITKIHDFDDGNGSRGDDTDTIVFALVRGGACFSLPYFKGGTTCLLLASRSMFSRTKSIYKHHSHVNCCLQKNKPPQNEKKNIVNTRSFEKNCKQQNKSSGSDYKPKSSLIFLYQMHTFTVCNNSQSDNTKNKNKSFFQAYAHFSALCVKWKREKKHERNE